MHCRNTEKIQVLIIKATLLYLVGYPCTKIKTQCLIRIKLDELELQENIRTEIVNDF